VLMLINVLCILSFSVEQILLGWLCLNLSLYIYGFDWLRLSLLLLSVSMSFVSCVST